MQAELLGDALGAHRGLVVLSGQSEPDHRVRPWPSLIVADDLTVLEEYCGIGVRIEDDILVTAAGNRNLSAALPRASSDVEAWMARLKG
ncbi:hypothetical protein [Streptomyces sp. NPDC001667]